MWCRSIAVRLGPLTYQQKRLALESLDVQVHVWKLKHKPRDEIMANIPLDDPIVTVTRTAPDIGGRSHKYAVRTGRFRWRGWLRRRGLCLALGPRSRGS